MTVYALMDSVAHLLPTVEEKDNHDLCRLIRVLRGRPDSYTAKMCLDRCVAEAKARGMDV